MPMQYNADFIAVKMSTFRCEFVMFSYVCLKYRLWVLVRMFVLQISGSETLENAAKRGKENC